MSCQSFPAPQSLRRSVDGSVEPFIESCASVPHAPDAVREGPASVVGSVDGRQAGNHLHRTAEHGPANVADVSAAGACAGHCVGGVGELRVSGQLCYKTMECHQAVRGSPI
eukprot:8190985-Alexandrium_andersonii.AAC.1